MVSVAATSGIVSLIISVLGVLGVLGILQHWWTTGVNRSEDVPHKRDAIKDYLSIQNRYI